MGVPIRHGTVGGYTNRECRCDECRDAVRRATAAYRARQTRERTCADGCGTVLSRYNRTSRCASCDRTHRPVGGSFAEYLR